VATHSLEPTVLRVATALDVGHLAADILRRDRPYAVVCVTIPSWGSEPFIDVDVLAATLGPAAKVYVLPTGDLSWDLTDRLPPRLDVYGGATRVWWPDIGAEPDPYQHPLFYLHDRSQSAEITEQILSAFEKRGLISNQRPEQGAEMAAVVTAVRAWGAQLTLEGGVLAAVQRSRLTRATGLLPELVLRPGQSVRVEIVSGVPSEGRLPVSLKRFEPDPWERVAAEYESGDLVDGVVDELRN
jgi:hypothetical protein